MYKMFPFVIALVLAFLLSNLSACTQTDTQETDAQEIPTKQVEQQQKIKPNKGNDGDNPAKTQGFVRTPIATLNQP